MEMITIPKGGRPRKPKMSLEAATQLLQEREQLNVQALANWYKVSESTMYRMLRQAEEVLYAAN